MSGSLIEAVEAMAGALSAIGATVERLQVYPYMNPNPTPPSLDIYPADPFQDSSGFALDMATYWTVRARVQWADYESGQKVLLRFLDRRDPASVEEALTADPTLGGVVQSVAVVPEGVSGYREYVQDNTTGGRLIGCEWRLEVTV